MSNSMVRRAVRLAVPGSRYPDDNLTAYLFANSLLFPGRSPLPFLQCKRRAHQELLRSGRKRQLSVGLLTQRLCTNSRLRPIISQIEATGRLRVSKHFCQCLQQFFSREGLLRKTLTPSSVASFASCAAVRPLAPMIFTFGFI